MKKVSALAGAKATAIIVRLLCALMRQTVAKRKS